MHELSLIASVFDILEEKTREHGASRVTAVVLRVGRMSGVVPDLLESAFETYKNGTLAEGARLTIEVVPVKLRCPDCGGTSVREDTDFSCTACGSRRVEIVEGREIVVEKIELETDGA
ncbi:MAG: hydrogenase maturation nickel metallochaperone HypA [Acidobacteria bacterium]|nr:hydrogenase maturation nickel metallochaperone HypA [Acidobacteriota bacterium]MBE3131747.1 hydrogenase maturation nickel metallochaperone HypA [Acidobacteriota bacterium]